MGKYRKLDLRKNQYLVNIDKKRAIFGICNLSELSKPINYILILTIFYIYKCHINNKGMNIANGSKNSCFSYILKRK